MPTQSVNLGNVTGPPGIPGQQGEPADPAITNQLRVDVDAATVAANAAAATAAGAQSAASAAQTIANAAQSVANSAVTAAATAQTRADEAFTSASEGKAALAGAIGLPATTTDTFPTLAARINTAKNTLANNLVAKGVTAAATEALQALAAKVASVSTGYSKIEEVAILSSQTYTIPSGVKTFDIALLGGGASSGGTTNQVGRGGSVNRYLNQSVPSNRQIVIMIGAGGPIDTATAGGATTATYGGNTRTADGGGLGTTGSVNTYRRIWADDTSLLVGGGGIMGGLPLTGTQVLNVMAGGGLQTGSDGLAIPPQPGYGGGGGGRYGTPSESRAGGSGRVQLRLYY